MVRKQFENDFHVGKYSERGGIVYLDSKRLYCRTPEK